MVNWVIGKNQRLDFYFATHPVSPVPLSLIYSVLAAPPFVRVKMDPTGAVTTPSGELDPDVQIDAPKPGRKFVENVSAHLLVDSPSDRVLL